MRHGATCGGLLFTPAFAWAIDALGFPAACYAAVAFVLLTMWPLAAFAFLRPLEGEEGDRIATARARRARETPDPLPVEAT